MEYERFDMGGATFFVAGDDGTSRTWVEPPLTQQQLQRTWKKIGTLELNTTVDLKDIGLRGCELTATTKVEGKNIVIWIAGCYDFIPFFDSQVLRIKGHGTRSCGLIAGNWKFVIPHTDTISVEQEWNWG